MTPDYSHITSRCFINVPFDKIDRYMDLVVTHKIQPELALVGESVHELPLSTFKHVSRTLEEHNLPCTLHAPFNDLAPAAADAAILRATRDKLRKTFELIPVFRPRSIVCHLGYEANKHSYDEEGWFARSLETWQELLEIAEKYRTPFMLENTYETGPEQHRRILAALNSPYAGFCLDLGHVQVFARGTWHDWLPALEPWLGHMHLHDNRGKRDDHIAIGQGTVDFSSIFEYLKGKHIEPIYTLEPHSEDALWGSLAALDKLNLF